jgi:hypothetical protein
MPLLDKPELKQHRSLFSRTYDLGSGQKQTRISTGPIHYNNKLELGDGVPGLRVFDYTLQEHKDGYWYFEYNNFIVKIPYISTDPSEFRDVWQDKDQTIIMTPSCNKIEGQLITADMLEKYGLQNVTDCNAVIYPGAFGGGEGDGDLCYAFCRTGLKKLIRWKPGQYPSGDMQLNFAVQLPGDLYRAQKVEEISALAIAKVDMTKDTQVVDSCK